MRHFLVHAQHCDGPFYMGWWLYCDPVGPEGVRHGRAFVSNGGGLWVETVELVRRVISLSRRHGGVMPDYKGHGFGSDRGASQAVAEAFAAVFPLGILVRADRADSWPADGGEVNRDARLLDGWPYGDEAEEV